MTTKQTLIVLSGLVILTLIGGLVTLRLTTTNFVPPPLPSPNGYDNLLLAAKQVHPRTGFYEEMATEELEQVVAHNAPALEIVREALELECGVSVDWSWDPAANGMNPIWEEVAEMRRLVRALSAEAHYRLSAGESAAAVDSGLDAFRLGTKCTEGGLMGGYLIGLAIRGQAIHELGKVVAQDSSRCQSVLLGLTPMLENGESADEVIQREKNYINYASRGLMGMLIVKQTGPLMEPATQAALQAERREQAKRRLFVLHLALRVYHDEHGAWPTSLDELLPDMLPAVPLDPYNESSFVYSVNDDGYLLYSVGENRNDDGGEGDETGLSGDLRYDLPANDAAAESR